MPSFNIDTFSNPNHAHNHPHKPPAINYLNSRVDAQYYPPSTNTSAA